MMSKSVFISYSTDDAPRAAAIRDGLEAAGIACWMAPRDIAPGADYAEQILGAIEACAVMVLVLSETSNQSRYVRNEVERAIAKDKMVIPVRIHDVTPSRSLEFFVSNAQWIDAWQGPLDGHVAALCAAIRSHLAVRPDGRAGGPAPSDMPSPVARVRNNLPAQLTRFIGRERAIAEVTRLLQTTRLLTLTGSGGTGKTRLALEIGAEIMPMFSDGVWQVELAALSDGALVAEGVAAALGLDQSNRSALSVLVEHLGSKHVLIVLDNCEHLIQACAELATALLRACSHLHILATSREVLGVTGELVWPVSPLQMPDRAINLTPAELGTFEAIRLFVDRAALVSPGFTLVGSNAESVRQICARLDGIPLAIELAAARLRTLTVEDIASRLGDRFRILTGGNRTAIPRHQTLRALIDWSYDLLTAAERSALRRLSVFAGSWMLEAAEAVCADTDIAAGDVLDLIGSLVDKSLVMKDARGGPRRYVLLETIRQYCAERAEDGAERRAARDRHLRYFVAYGERISPQLGDLSRELQNYATSVDADRTAAQIRLIHHLVLDFDDIRRALDWAAETRRVDDGLRLLTAVTVLFTVREGQKELLARYRALLEQPAQATDRRVHAWACWWVSEMYHRQSEFDLSRTWMERAEASAAQVDDPELQFDLLRLRALDGHVRGEYSTALDYLERANRVAAANGYFGRARDIVEGDLAWMEGRMMLSQGDYAGAVGQLRLSHAAQVAAGNIFSSTARSRYLGYALLYANDVAESAERLKESLLGNYSVMDKQAVAACLAAWAAFALAQGEPSRAARLFGASAMIQTSLHIKLMPLDAEQVDKNLAILRKALSPAEFEHQWAAGAAMSMEQARDLALASDPVTRG